MTTLNDMIRRTITGSEASEDDATADVVARIADTDGAAIDSADLAVESEKLASALDYIGRVGVENVLVKEAMTCRCGYKMPKGAKKCPKCGMSMEKKAMHGEGGMHGGGYGNVGVNDGPGKTGTSGSTVGPNSASPSMKEPGYGKIPNNEDARPGGGGAVDTAGKGTGSHHSSLKSNEAAINYDKKEKAKQVDSSLQAVLDAKPFADGVLKKELTGAGGKGDRNIHSKTAHSLQAVRAELERRAAAAQGTN